MKKVLVLGAGASKAYGYPVGSDLRTLITNLTETEARSCGILGEYYSKDDLGRFIEFKEAFRLSQLYSIDAFLGRRQEFSEVGKLAIASVLLRAESDKVLFSEQPGKDHWYQYLFNQIARDTWEEFSFDDLAIVTFNYDRSLELYLLTTIQATYKVSRAEAATKVKSFQIIHVYGCLCDKLPGVSGYIKADGKLDPDKSKVAASGLNVIPEGRIDAPTLIAARQALREADSICFLGFGFDPMNVERLSAEDACAASILRPTGHVARRVVGTRLGMTDAEMGRAFFNLTRQPISLNKKAFQEVNCTEVLRNTGFLF